MSQHCKQQFTGPLPCVPSKQATSTQIGPAPMPGSRNILTPAPKKFRFFPVQGEGLPTFCQGFSVDL